MNQPQGLPEGIYLNLSNEDYHNDPALSHSGMTKVLISWPDYWVSSCLNTKRDPFKRTAAMLFGERSGMLLTQPELFYSTYNTYNKAKPNLKGQYLSSMEWQDIKDSVDAILNVPIAKQHYKNGYAEVSVFWRDPGTGIMLRCRYDWLLIFGAVENKRVDEINNWNIGRAVKKYGYDIQAFLYLEGIKAARRMLKNMEADQITRLAKTEGFDEGWLKDFRDDTDLLFRFLFQRSKAPYIWEFRELSDDVLIEGGHAVFASIKKYKRGLEMFGICQPPLGYDTVNEISSLHVPRRDYDYE